MSWLKASRPLLAALCLCAEAGVAQEATELTLRQAVEAAIRRYPSIQASREQANAAAAGIQLARTAYLPKIDALAQVNRATRNNVFGLVLPQSTLPSISGPVIGSDNFGTVWGSAVGTLVTWEPFDFGLRRESVAAATAARAAAEAGVQKTQFEVAAQATDAYLTLVAAQESVKAANAGVERAAAVLKTVAAQAGAELRPGADQSRAEAEVAAARTEAIRGEEAVEVARANLAQFTGMEPGQIRVSTGTLSALPADRAPAVFSSSSNPIAVAQHAAIEREKVQLRALERSYFPRFYAQASAYARGSGAETNGGRLGGANGLAPNVQNYAVGFTVVFPVMDWAAVRAREAAQSASIRAETARSEQIALELRTQWNRAVAALNGARRVAENLPVQVAAARRASEQATARYQAGLSNIDEVAEAQRLLTQAEIDQALSRLNVWRGLLGIAIAAGDIQPFVAEAGQ
jgi:outer membrane protein TolC